MNKDIAASKKPTPSVSAEAEHLRLKGEMIARVTTQIEGQNWTDTPLSDDDKTCIEMAVGAALGELGITLPFIHPPAPMPADTNLAGAALSLLPFDKVPDDFLDRLILDKSHSETSIVTFPEQDGLVITKPIARLILALRMAMAETDRNGR